MDEQCCSGLFITIDFLFDLSIIEGGKPKLQIIILATSLYVFDLVRVYLMHVDALLICVCRLRVAMSPSLIALKP